MLAHSVDGFYPHSKTATRTRLRVHRRLAYGYRLRAVVTSGFFWPWTTQTRAIL